MVRLEYLLVLLVYVLSSVQLADGMEIPAPISDVIKRLEDLEKRLLIQEKKNEDLEKRLLEQDALNKVQGEIIQNKDPCDCPSNEKATTYFSDGRY